MLRAETICIKTPKVYFICIYIVVEIIRGSEFFYFCLRHSNVLRVKYVGTDESRVTNANKPLDQFVPRRKVKFFLYQLKDIYTYVYMYTYIRSSRLYRLHTAYLGGDDDDDDQVSERYF